MLVYGKYECFVMFVSCGSSQCCIMHDLQLMLVEDARGDHMEELVCLFVCLWVCSM